MFYDVEAAGTLLGRLGNYCHILLASNDSLLFCMSAVFVGWPLQGPKMAPYKLAAGTLTPIPRVCEVPMCSLD